MAPVGFETTIPAGERPQTYAIDRAATETGRYNVTQFIYIWKLLYMFRGRTSTHHQEHIQLYLQHLVFVTPLLLSAAMQFQIIQDTSRQQLE
jgi:hypothetical protein